MLVERLKGQQGFLHMSNQRFERFEDHDRRPRPTMLFGYVALSLSVGATVWGAIISLSVVNSDLEPADVVAAALGFERQIDDPMIVARDSDWSLIEPAAGPAKGCK